MFLFTIHHHNKGHSFLITPKTQLLMTSQDNEFGQLWIDNYPQITLPNYKKFKNILKEKTAKDNIHLIELVNAQKNQALFILNDKTNFHIEIVNENISKMFYNEQKFFINNPIQLIEQIEHTFQNQTKKSSVIFES